MSSAGWVLLVLLFICPIYEASEVKDESSEIAQRRRRSLTSMNDMVSAVTGKQGYEFVGYGNWCGIGGSGVPVDPIDECCQNHDLCYDVTKQGACRGHEKAVYLVNYNWRLADDETAVCEEEKLCEMAVCLCDAVLTNCLKSNLQFYDGDKVNTKKFNTLVEDVYNLFTA